jgi:hypothetical protein
MSESVKGMRALIYAIGGEWKPSASGDHYLGAAHDVTTALSLIDLVESKGGYAVSIHAIGLSKNWAVSGEFSVDAARKLFIDQWAEMV